MPLPKVSIKKGREWQVSRGHPWLFSGGISQVPANLGAGEIVDLVDVEGSFVARGYYNPACDIAVRVLTRNLQELIDRSFVKRRVEQALELRRGCIDFDHTNVYRLINAEGDYLPGIIADRLADVIVLQSHTAGGDRLLPDVISVVSELMRPTSIVIRNDALIRKREGLELEPPRVVSGACPEGAEPESLHRTISVLENHLKFGVDPMGGQKTGFFADQRDKRLMVKNICQHLPAGSVLANCFSYSAGFSVYAAAGNPHLRSVNIDESESAHALARDNFAMNRMLPDNHALVKADAFGWLEGEIAGGRRYQLVVLDPPAFAKGHKDRAKARKAYARLNFLGLSCCAPGAYLLTCSCSGSVSLDEFLSSLQLASVEANRTVQVLQVFKHGIDHPVSLSCPETEYLKVFLCRVT